MADSTHIQEHMEILGSDGDHVGTVDRVEGARIKLTRTDPAAGGEHHFIHVDSVDAVEDGKVRLNRTGAEARDEWGVESVGGPASTTLKDEHRAEAGSARVGP
ncbi:hypothetical protein M673_13830 [Aureimonas sp. AU20]|nr:hypothetical protein M673_13830 [Aureimonas sp. AU20]